MSEFDIYTRVDERLPQEDMLCDVIGVRPDGVFRTMRMFYRAKPKKEYFVDNNGKRRTRKSGTGFVVQQAHNGFKVIGWKKHISSTDLASALYGKENKTDGRIVKKA